MSISKHILITHFFWFSSLSISVFVPAHNKLLLSVVLDIRAHLLVFFFLVVVNLLGASVLGVRARNNDGFHEMFHP
jgi:hypothetical protein